MNIAYTISQEENKRRTDTSPSTLRLKRNCIAVLYVPAFQYLQKRPSSSPALNILLRLHIYENTSLTSREYIINSDSMLFHEILRTVAIKNGRLVNGIFLNIIFNIKLPHLNPPPHEHSRYNVTRRTFYTMPCLNIIQCCTENGVRLQLCRCWLSGL